MNLIQAAILGVVEGATEFLPISSTFHLIFSSKLMGIPQTDFAKLFEVFIQSGAVLAIASLYLRELLKDRKLQTMLLGSFIPTAVVGFSLYKVIKGVFFEAEMLMILAFAIMGVVFISLEYFTRGGKNLKKSFKDITLVDALIIGVVQALAVVPGVSRAGSVMVGMMILGYKRNDAAHYSFLLAVPTILMASAYDMYKMRDVAQVQGDNLLLLIVGTTTAAITAYIVVKWFIDFLKENTLMPFGLYRIILAIILLLISLQ